MELFHGFSPLNCLNIRRTPFLKNISGWLLLFLWKSIQQVVTGIHLFRVKLKLIFLTKKKTNQGWIWDQQIIYDGALCGNIISESHFALHWQSSSNLDDEGIVKLPLYAIIFSSVDKIGSMGGEKNPEDSSISHIGTFFLFSVRGKIVLSVLGNGSSLIYQFVLWRFCNVFFESVVLFWKY